MSALSRLRSTLLLRIGLLSCPGRAEPGKMRGTIGPIKYKHSPDPAKGGEEEAEKISSKE